MGTVPKTVIDDTILITPKPQASSTTTKKPSEQIYDLKKTVLSYTPTSAKTQCPERPVIETSSQNIIEMLQLQRMLTKSFIESSGAAGLPSRFFHTSEVSENSTGTFLIHAIIKFNINYLLILFRTNRQQHY